MSNTVKGLGGKVALVTGSSRGIGAAILLRLASHGANVVVNYHSSEAAAEEVAKKARGLGVRAIRVKADVSDPEAVARLFEAAVAEFGGLDIVMSNSGIEHFGDVESVKVEDINRIFATNVTGQYLVAQQAHKHLRDYGRLILMSSISAVWGVPRHAIYAASKAAISGMVKCLAFDFGRRQITVNCIAPGGVKTDMWTEVAKDYLPGGDRMTDEEVTARIASTSPMNRVAYPDDIAGVVSCVASSEAQWLTGQTFHCSGGVHMATA